MLRSIKYGVNGAILAGLIAAPVLWTTVDKSVQLVVDGNARTVRTTAASVGQVLDGHGYRVTSHDLVAPSAKAHVRDGSRIVLRRGRLLNLDVDGRRMQVWTTAPTVRAALAQLGFSAGDFVSVSRSRRLPLGATSIAIRTPRNVSVIHDGRTDHVISTQANVAGLLTDMQLRLDSDDRLSAPMSAALYDNEVIRLQRVGKKLISKTVKVPYATKRSSDASLSKGSTRIVTAGRNGKVKITYALIYVDGKLAGKTKLKALTLRAARAQLVKVGTKTSAPGHSAGSNVATAPAPSPGTAKDIARTLLVKRGWGDQYSCLVTLWNHESGWRVHAENSGSGAYGIPQALPGSKMASAGSNWHDSAETQIKWGLNYIASRYGDPCGAWSTWQAHGGWY